MNIKTTRELAFFMAGIQAGRTLKVMYMGGSAKHLAFADLNESLQIVIHLRDGSIDVETCTDGDPAWFDDCRADALVGMLKNAEVDAERAFDSFERYTSKQNKAGVEL